MAVVSGNNMISDALQNIVTVILKWIMNDITKSKKQTIASIITTTSSKQDIQIAAILLNIYQLPPQKLVLNDIKMYRENLESCLNIPNPAILSYNCYPKQVARPNLLIYV